MTKIAFSDLRVLSLLPGALAPYVQPNELEVILKNLQDNLFEGYAKPSAEALWATTSKCRRCPAATGTAQMPMWNLKDPKVLFIAEERFQYKGTIEVFMEAMKSCGFSSSDVCLTYMTRCPFDKVGAKEEDKERCVEYLWTEIVALSPAIIVPMGATVTSYFFTSQNLGAVKSTEKWIGPWRFYPTFSPTYVVASESDKISGEFMADMKKIRSLIP